MGIEQPSHGVSGDQSTEVTLEDESETRFEGDWALVDIDRKVPARAWLPSPGAQPTKFEKDTFVDELTLVYEEQGWKVEQIRPHDTDGPAVPPYAW
ncbi:MAG TPA: hypothetical protein VI076_04515 [Actinopolymorphaceae bacterium]